MYANLMVAFAEKLSEWGEYTKMNFDMQCSDMTLTLSNRLKLEIHPISGLHRLRRGASGRLL